MFPFMINIQHKKIVIIGGGKVAARRIESLIRWQPQLTVISPTLEASLQRYVESGEIQYKKRTFRALDVSDAFIVIAATNDAKINQAVKNSCTPNQLVNLVDDPDNSSFHFPAVYENNNITVAVTTNGMSPMLTKSLRDEFAAIIDQFEPAYLLFLKEVRQLVQQKSFSKKQKHEWLEECLKELYQTDSSQRMLLIEKILSFKSQ